MRNLLTILILACVFSCKKKQDTPTQPEPQAQVVAQNKTVQFSFNTIGAKHEGWIRIDWNGDGQTDSSIIVSKPDMGYVYNLNTTATGTFKAQWYYKGTPTTYYIYEVLLDGKKKAGAQQSIENYSIEIPY